MSNPTAFLSYDFHADTARAVLVERLGVVTTQPVPTVTEREKLGLNPALYQSWVDRNLADKDGLIVLVGTRTSLQPHIRYELERAVHFGKLIIGVRVHALCPSGVLIAAPGLNPFNGMALADADGSVLRPRLLAPRNDHAEDDIRRHLVRWMTLAWHAQGAHERRRARLRSAAEEDERLNAHRTPYGQATAPFTPGRTTASLQ